MQKIGNKKVIVLMSLLPLLMGAVNIDQQAIQASDSSKGAAIPISAAVSSQNIGTGKQAEGIEREKKMSGLQENATALEKTVMPVTMVKAIQSKDQKQASRVVMNEQRIRSVAYSASEALVIQTRHGYATQVVLDPQEAVQAAIGGDTDGWVVLAKEGGHLLFLKPKSTARKSNLIVATTKRNYVFSLNVLSAEEAVTNNGDWQINFQYPDDAQALQVAILQQQEALREQQSIKDRLNTPVKAANWNYSMQAFPGSEEILPSKAYDDGRFTYITISNNREMPSVFRIAADGAESIVDRHIEGRDTLVIHEVARRFVLRLGKQVVGVWNDSFDADGKPPVKGVAADGVERVLGVKQ